MALLKQSTLSQQLHANSPPKSPFRSASVGLALLASAGTFGFASEAVQAAAATWSPEQVITNTTQATNIRTAVNATGTSVVIWDQLVPGSADATHLYGRWQVYGSVCTPQPAPQVPNCSAPKAFTDGTTVPDATNAGAVVAPSGTVTVFWNSFATPTAYSESSSSSNAGSTWSAAELVPGDGGYTLLSGVYAELGPSVGADGNGNIIVAMVNPPVANPIAGTGYSVQTLVKDGTTGNWSLPVQLSNAASIFGSAKLFVNSDGQALLNLGFTSFRRHANGNWGSPQTVSTAGMGQIYSASAGFDAGGKAYFVYRSRYKGSYLSTSTPTLLNPNPAWTTPKSIAKFDTFGPLVIRGSSAGHAMVYGEDYSTGNVRASVTANGGSTWGGVVNFGAGDSPQAAGSENGLFALSWNSGGANWDRYFVASGTGIGTGTAAWVKNNLIGNFASGSVAIAADTLNGNAKKVGGWTRWDAVGDVVGASLGTVAP